MARHHKGCSAQLTLVGRPRESDVTRSIAAYLRALGIPLRRHQVIKQKLSYTNKYGITKARWVCSGEPGQCDRWLTLPGSGRLVEVEIKRPGEVPRPNQIAYMIASNASGAIAFWVDNLDTFMKVFSLVLRGWRIQMAQSGDYAIVPPGR